jgi:predicted nicotinamide N-methyase
MPVEHDALERQLRSRFETVETEVTIAGRGWRLLRPRSADDLISEEEFNQDGRLPYWAEVWPSARVLAERIAQLNGAGGTLLELGGGIGLGALQGAASSFDATASDYYLDALEFTQLNAQRHNLPNLQTRMIDWRNLPSDLGKYNVVVAADVLYEKTYCQLVAQAIHAALAADGIAFVTDPHRTIAEGFPQACTDAGLVICQHSRSVVPFAGAQVTVDLFELRHPNTTGANT